MGDGEHNVCKRKNKTPYQSPNEQDFVHVFPIVWLLAWLPFFF